MKSSRSRGFSLLELLLAMAILSMVLIFLATAVGAVTRTWQSGTARIDNFSKARVILGLLDRDLQSAVLRSDLAAFVDENGSNACAFYTQISGGTGNRRLSLVRYGLTNTATNSLLQRSDYGLDYTTATLSLANTNNLPDLTRTVTQDISDGILRFEWQFVAADGTFQTNYRYDSAIPNSSSNTRAVVISFIALDDRALKIAYQTGTLTNLLGKFAGQPAAGQTYGAYWNTGLRAANFAANLPGPLSGGVRVFERHYSLH